MRKMFPVILAILLAAACSKQEAQQKTSNAVDKVTTKVQNLVDDVSAPMGKPENAADRESERFDARWRQLESFRAQQAAQLAAQQQQQAAAAAAAPPANFVFVSNKKESFKGLDANAINNAPVAVPITGDVRGPSVLRAQVYLDRLHFSVGSIDGRWGRNSAITVWWFQRTRGLEATGDVDEPTFLRIASEAGYPPVVVQHTLSADDVKGPFHAIPEDVYEQAKLSELSYESLREKLSEQFHCTEDFLELLNPDVKLATLQAGQTINVPNVRPAMTAGAHDITRIVISISGNSLSGFDANNNLVVHAPTTVGAGYDPSPSETLRIVKIVSDPQFHYDPTLYHEVPDTNPDAHLPPGPNSPVGVVWIALSKEHYGIHGTKDPDSIGYASSHGCVRLSNWDAEELEHRAGEGVQVSFVDARSKGLPAVARK
ncbi:MAG TPA: L,D-transpeptidase [Thermoanaerobaculia bacterium]|nr:L,D-transpeptidase [Thermoanaerobaculia bacterium]